MFRLKHIIRGKQKWHRITILLEMRIKETIESVSRQTDVYDFILSIWHCYRFQKMKKNQHKIYDKKLSKEKINKKNKSSLCAHFTNEENCSQFDPLLICLVWHCCNRNVFNFKRFIFVVLSFPLHSLVVSPNERQKLTHNRRLMTNMFQLVTDRTCCVVIVVTFCFVRIFFCWRMRFHRHWITNLKTRTLFDRLHSSITETAITMKQNHEEEEIKTNKTELNEKKMKLKTIRSHKFRLLCLNRMAKDITMARKNGRTERAERTARFEATKDDRKQKTRQTRVSESEKNELVECEN